MKYAHLIRSLHFCWVWGREQISGISFIFSGSFKCWKMLIFFLFVYAVSVSCGKHFVKLEPRWRCVWCWLVSAVSSCISSPVADSRHEVWRTLSRFVSRADVQRPTTPVTYSIRTSDLDDFGPWENAHAVTLGKCHTLTKTPCWESNPQSQHCEATMLIAGCFFWVSPFFFLSFPSALSPLQQPGEICFLPIFSFLSVCFCGFRGSFQKKTTKKTPKYLGVPDSN